MLINEISRLSTSIGIKIKAIDAALKALTGRVDAIAANNNYEQMKKYVQSRGSGLITNGYGLLKDNTNFSRFVFTPTESYAGFGSFYSRQNSVDLSIDEFIPINPKSKYNITFFARTSNKVGTPLAFFYIALYDSDGNAITPETLSRVNFRLGAPLVPGGEVIIHADDIYKVKTFLDAFGTRTSNVTLNDSQYTTQSGFKIKEGTYSRTRLANFPTAASLSLVGNKLIGFAIPATTNKPGGYLVSLGMTDSTYIYPMITTRTEFVSNRRLVNDEIPTTWTDYNLTFVLETMLPILRASAPTMTDKTIYPNMGDSMAAAATSMKIGWLLNRGSGAGNETMISAIQMREI